MTKKLTTLRADFQLDVTLPEPKTLDKESLETRAQIADQVVRNLVHIMGRSWVLMGEYVMYVHDNELWKVLGFGSFTAWVKNATWTGRTTAYAAMRVVRDLNIARDKMLTMTKENAEQLLRLRTYRPDILDKDLDYWIEKSKLKEHELEALIDSALRNENVEIKKTTKLKLDESLALLLEETIEMAQVLNGSPNKSDAIERIITDFREAENMDFPQMSNAEVFNKLLERAKARKQKVKDADGQDIPTQA